ncbi:MAG: HD family hydrolase [Robiginitomaculum sp.]|nr:HD family hydrolase [Robiginitomaculum sp.]
MLSGRRLDLLDPSPFDIEVEDIALGLARVARWNGQTSGDHAFSVAEHSVIVERLFSLLNPKANQQDQLTALLHDAAEYVIGDMISPFKAALNSKGNGLDYKDFEARLETAVHLRFSLPATPSPTLVKAIKKADIYCAYFEAVQIAGFTTTEADKYFTRPPNDIRIIIEPLSVAAAEKLFLQRFTQLTLD